MVTKPGLKAPPASIQRSSILDPNILTSPGGMCPYPAGSLHSYDDDQGLLLLCTQIALSKLSLAAGSHVPIYYNANIL